MVPVRTRSTAMSTVFGRPTTIGVDPERLQYPSAFTQVPTEVEVPSACDTVNSPLKRPSVSVRTEPDDPTQTVAPATGAPVSSSVMRPLNGVRTCGVGGGGTYRRPSTIRTWATIPSQGR